MVFLVPYIIKCHCVLCTCYQQNQCKKWKKWLAKIMSSNYAIKPSGQA